MSLVGAIKPLILASGSTTRRQQLERVGLSFTVIKPNIDEELLKQKYQSTSSKDLGNYLARSKAQSVSELYPDAYVIGADQICEFNNKIFDKPGCRESSIQQLTLLSGTTHLQHCSATIFHQNKSIWDFYAQAELTMRNLSQAEIEAYVDLEKPYHSCGSYMFESYGKHLFEKVLGDHDVILGLPIVELLAELYRLDILYDKTFLKI